MRILIGVLAGLATAQGAAGQPGYTFVLSASELSPAAPSVTVQIMAGYEPGAHYAFAGARFDVIATEPAWSDPALRMPLVPGTSAGAVSPDGMRVDGALAGQLHFPVCDPGPPCAPDTSNPLAIWEATFTVTDFAPRMITLTTQTAPGDYRVYLERESPISIAVAPIEGFARIRVIPAPGAGALLAAGALVSAARRRGH